MSGLGIDLWCSDPCRRYCSNQGLARDASGRNFRTSLCLNELNRPGGEIDADNSAPVFHQLTTALLDRLTHHCHIMETGNDSYRFKNSSAQPTQPKKESKTKKLSTR